MVCRHDELLVRLETSQRPPPPQRGSPKSPEVRARIRFRLSWGGRTWAICLPCDIECDQRYHHHTPPESTLSCARSGAPCAVSLMSASDPSRKELRVAAWQLSDSEVPSLLVSGVAPSDYPCCRTFGWSASA
eukprot:171674-Amphidinium_carterae.3